MSKLVERVVERSINYAEQRASRAAHAKRKSSEGFSYHTGIQLAYEDMAQLLRLGLAAVHEAAETTDTAEVPTLAEYRESNDLAQRPPREIAEPKLLGMLHEAITTAYTSGSIGATHVESTPDYELTVSFKIERIGGAS